ncbi:hypothetical protein [Mesobacillus harenae]|uniref:hypothetical protein n=1 Tax=Mesobacillus harenae TaxID=2213203 RepID=UPI00158005DF|nr:hypothetical protein [Mesobacillus harenae]
MNVEVINGYPGKAARSEFISAIIPLFKNEFDWIHFDLEQIYRSDKATYGLKKYVKGSLAKITWRESR